mgnify:CR=1 FL=1
MSTNEDKFILGAMNSLPVLSSDPVNFLWIL